MMIGELKHGYHTCPNFQRGSKLPDSQLYFQDSRDLNNGLALTGICDALMRSSAGQSPMNLSHSEGMNNERLILIYLRRTTIHK